MNKVFHVKKEDRKLKWRVIDAQWQVLGRFATQIADILREKDKLEYFTHVDVGDYVVVINCEKIVLTGKKFEYKIYKSYSAWRGGLKKRPIKKIMEKDPTLIIKYAVKGMLPKNKINRQIKKN